jgi:radical SAM protein (TIGR04043 family)
MRQIALLHGKDCLASTVYQGCAFWGTPRQCKFCGIGLSLEQKATVLQKTPDDLAAAAVSAASLDCAAHVTLTSGAWADDQEGLSHMCACIRMIRHRSGLPVHVQVHLPRCHGDLIMLREAGADTIGLHIEVPTSGLLAEMAPAKAERGLDDYVHFWRSAVALFGRNQVSSFLIAGCGESAEELLSMAETMAGLGVFPYVLPLRPIPQTPLADRLPPDPGYMIDIYGRIARILSENGLSSSASKAGCVRCGACSCLSLFERK